MIGKAIESTVEHAEESVVNTTPQAVLSGKPPRVRGVGFALFVASIALFFTVVGIAAGYKHWQRMHDRAKDNARRVEVLETALATKMDGRDLAALMTLPMNNVAIVSTKINQLLAQLPPRAELSKPPVVAKNKAENKAVSNQEVVTGDADTSPWSVYKQRMLAVFSRFVVVQKMEPDKPSTVAALKLEERSAVHELLRLRLESLRLMALQGDVRVYRQQLALLRSTLDDTAALYAPEQLSVWRAALDELGAIDLQPKHHNISNGLRQLRQSQQEAAMGVGQ